MHWPRRFTVTRREPRTPRSRRPTACREGCRLLIDDGTGPTRRGWIFEFPVFRVSSFEFPVSTLRFVPGLFFGATSALKHLPSLFQVCFWVCFNSKGLTRFVPGLFLRSCY